MSTVFKFCMKFKVNLFLSFTRQSILKPICIHLFQNSSYNPPAQQLTVLYFLRGNFWLQSTLPLLLYVPTSYFNEWCLNTAQCVPQRLLEMCGFVCPQPKSPQMMSDNVIPLVVVTLLLSLPSQRSINPPLILYRPSLLLLFSSLFFSFTPLSPVPCINDMNF